jgi:hypothetical protein
MMKGTLTLLLIAMVALMGFASAYPTVNENLSYSFAKTVYDVQGNPSLSGTQSGAFSYCPGVEGYPSDGNTAALIQTKVVSAGGAMDMYPNNTGSTWQKVVQGGSSTLNMLALDPQDTDAELTAQVGTYQSVSFSGPYADYAASFADNAQVGTNNFCDIRDPQADGDNSVSWCGNAWIDESSTSSGAITKVSSDDVRIAEGTIGTQTWTGLSADGWTGDVYMNGGSVAYSQFYGPNVVPVNSGIQTTATATTSHTWNNGVGPSVPTI